MSDEMVVCYDDTGTISIGGDDEPDEAGGWSEPQTVPYYRTQRVGRRR